MNQTTLKATIGGISTVAIAGGLGLAVFKSNTDPTTLTNSELENEEKLIPWSGTGKEYTRYSLINSTTGNDKEGWETRFETYKDNFTGENKEKDIFGTVTEGYSDTTNTALNKVCEASENTNSEILNEMPDNEENISSKFLIKNIWKFCSKEEINTVEDKGDDYGDKKIGGKEDNKKWFISAKDKNNEWFWIKQHEAAWSSDKEGFKQRSEYLMAILNLKSTLDYSSLDAIRHICETSYDTDLTNANSKKIEEYALLLCSINPNL